MTGTPKRRLKNFDFSGGDAAIALVSKDQMGAANGYKTLIQKATDVVVELSMAEFLTRFTDMWSGDAQMVANMLNYSDETSALWDHEELLKRVHLMKAADTSSPKLLETVDIISKSMNVTITDLESIKKSNGVSPISDNNQDGEIPMTQELDIKAEVQKALADEREANQIALTKAVDEAVAATKLEAANETEEIRKGLQDKLDEHEAKQEEVRKAQFITIAKGYKSLGVTDENAEAHAVALMKAAGDETLKPLTDMLEKAQNIVKNVEEGTFQELGHDLDTGETPEVSGVMKALQLKKEARKA